MHKDIFKRISVLLLLAIVMSGCENIGNAPAGPSAQETKKEIEAMKPQEQINLIKGSPLTPDKKAARIKEIEDKYGVKDQSAGENPGPPQHG